MLSRRFDSLDDPPMQFGHSDNTTQGIRVIVSAEFLPDQSMPEQRQFLFTYRVSMTNEGERWAKLLSRRWVITDAHGEVRVVEGLGVVGEQPELAPGTAYEYMSGCPMPTDWGTMEGHFVMQREDGETFEAQVGRFFLAPNTRLLASRA